MELKTPKAKKKSNLARLISWGKMFRTPLLILFLLGTTNCENNSESDVKKAFDSDGRTVFDSSVKKIALDTRIRHLHYRKASAGFDIQPANQSVVKKLSEIKFLRRHMNKQVLNFLMTDVLIDGEVENRVHYNGVTAKETYVGADGNGLRLRQLTDGRHLVQVIYNQNGDIQDCEYITSQKSVRNFLKTLRKEVKEALDEQDYVLMEKPLDFEREKFYRHFGNVTFKILKDKVDLPVDVSSWFSYDKLRDECIQRHEEIKYMMENNNKVGGVSLARFRRSFRENFILPGTKWCGAGQLAEAYHELGVEKKEDTCCRAHDNCRVNIGQFKRRFGYFNYRPYTISHCRCDRRFRACLKLADTSVSNMVGKLFFNVVQTKCFTLKPMKMCTKRSWWGKCLRKGYRKQAYLRDNLPY